MLRGMLELAGSSTRLVLLNCCSLSSMGYEFVAAGVPHVVCCSCDLKDLAFTMLFKRVFLHHIDIYIYIYIYCIILIYIASY